MKKIINSVKKALPQKKKYASVNLQNKPTKVTVKSK